MTDGNFADAVLRSWQMGELIVLQRQASQARRQNTDQASAEILFFTGVRYMRMPETTDALASVTPKRAPKSRRGSRKRDDAKSA